MAHASEAALLRAIIAAPDDNLPRLVYADWREEHNIDEAFIRISLSIAELEARLAILTSLEWDTLVRLRIAKDNLWNSVISRRYRIFMGQDSPYYLYFGNYGLHLGLPGQLDINLAADRFLLNHAHIDDNTIIVRADRNIRSAPSLEHQYAHIPFLTRKLFNFSSTGSLELNYTGTPFTYLETEATGDNLDQLHRDGYIDPQTLKGLFIRDLYDDREVNFKPRSLQHLYLRHDLPSESFIRKLLEESAKNRSLTHFGMFHYSAAHLRAILELFPELHTLHVNLGHYYHRMIPNGFVRDFHLMLERSHVRALTLRIPSEGEITQIGGSHPVWRYSFNEVLKLEKVTSLRSLHVIFSDSSPNNLVIENLHNLIAKHPGLIDLRITLVGQGRHKPDKNVIEKLLSLSKVNASLKFLRIKLESVSSAERSVGIAAMQEVLAEKSKQFSTLQRVSIELGEYRESFRGRNDELPHTAIFEADTVCEPARQRSVFGRLAEFFKGFCKRKK